MTEPSAAGRTNGRESSPAPELAVDMEAGMPERPSTVAYERASTRRKAGKSGRHTVPRSLIKPGSGGPLGLLGRAGPSIARCAGIVSCPPAAWPGLLRSSRWLQSCSGMGRATTSGRSGPPDARLRRLLDQRQGLRQWAVLPGRAGHSCVALLAVCGLFFLERSLEKNRAPQGSRTVPQSVQDRHPPPCMAIGYLSVWESRIRAMG
jgi:hypothetical protein